MSVQLAQDEHRYLKDLFAGLFMIGLYSLVRNRVRDRHQIALLARKFTQAT